MISSKYYFEGKMLGNVLLFPLFMFGFYGWYSVFIFEYYPNSAYKTDFELFLKKSDYTVFYDWSRFIFAILCFGLVQTVYVTTRKRYIHLVSKVLLLVSMFLFTIIYIKMLYFTIQYSIFQHTIQPCFSCLIAQGLVYFIVCLVILDEVILEKS